MQRRTAIKQLGTIGLLAGFSETVSFFLSSCNAAGYNKRAGYFTEEEFSVLEQLCDVVLPKTKSPAASEVQTAYFIELVTKDCLQNEKQEIIKKGLQDLQKQKDKVFTSMITSEKTKLVSQLDEAAFKEEGAHEWYRLVKKLACVGYFTSKDGCITALDHTKAPGEYAACIPYHKGDKSMSKTYLIYY